MKDEDCCLSPSAMLADLNEVTKVSNIATVASTNMMPSSGVAVGRVISVNLPPGAGTIGSNRPGAFGAKQNQNVTVGTNASNKTNTIIVMPISHGNSVEGQPVTKKIKTA